MAEVFVQTPRHLYSPVDETGGAVLLYPAGSMVPWSEAVKQGIAPDQEHLFPDGVDGSGVVEAPGPSNANVPGRKTRPARSTEIR